MYNHLHLAYMNAVLNLGDKFNQVHNLDMVVECYLSNNKVVSKLLYNTVQSSVPFSCCLLGHTMCRCYVSEAILPTVFYTGYYFPAHSITYEVATSSKKWTSHPSRSSRPKSQNNLANHKKVRTNYTDKY